MLRRDSSVRSRSPARGCGGSSAERRREVRSRSAWNRLDRAGGSRSARRRDPRPAPGADLVRRGDQRVVYAEADQIPDAPGDRPTPRDHFRAAGEGTGRTSDLDRFDEWYYHLIHWNDATNEIVGAYRLGATDRIIPSRGIDGMYTRTLFHYDTGLLHELGPSLEMGRSFIRPEYQRRSEPLMLLWKGIGRFSGRFPRYRHLFGPVSIVPIPRDLDPAAPLSRRHQADLRISLVRLNDLRGGRPATGIPPPSARSTASTTSTSSSGRSSGTNGRFRSSSSSTKLGGVFMGFNVDPEFSDVVDSGCSSTCSR